MATQDTLPLAGAAAPGPLADALGQQLFRFVEPLLVELDRLLDKRLVRTCLATLSAIVRHRHRASGLLLSELGAFLRSPDQAPAGTKRLSNLLRSQKWTHAVVERFLWRRADAQLKQLEARAELTLLLWDESVLEKPESIALEGLCAVRSTKAARIKRIKPGFYNPPGGRPVFVPGLKWLSVMLIGLSGLAGPGVLAAMRFWTTRGKYASDRHQQQRALLQDCVRAWGCRLLHVFDRGFAGEPWLAQLLEHKVRFVVRWPKHYKLRDGTGRVRKAWQITQGKRSWGQRWLWDARRRCLRKTGVVAVAVEHKRHGQPLYLVVSRPGKGRAPWYLLTNEPVECERQAWAVVLAYARRWQIEMAWRYSKTELAMESPRLWFWENRLKLLALVSLVYAFLVLLLKPEQQGLCRALLAWGCPRTGKRSREVSTPLYRMRFALGQLWQAHPPPLHFPIQTPG